MRCAYYIGEMNNYKGKKKKRHPKMGHFITSDREAGRYKKALRAFGERGKR